MKAYDAESAKSLTVVLHSEFYIGEALFQIVFLKKKEGLVVAGKWVNPNFSFEMNELADNFGILLPEFLNFELVIEELGIEYTSADYKLVLEAVIRHFGNLSLEAWKNPNQPAGSYKLALDYDRRLELSSLPIIGRFCNPGDGFIFKGLDLRYTANVDFKFSFLAQLVMKQLAVNLDIEYIQSLKNKLALPQLPENASQLPKNTIHWLDIHKGFGVLYFSKIGVSLVESEVTLYLDASFTISLIRLDFYELNVSTSLKDLSDFDFGLSGLMVTLEKPGFSLTGGLYKSAEEKTLYNGVLGLKIGQYSLQALGSYGEMPGSGEMTFFAYLMLGLPLGGPPFFFVNGLAFGLGVNRSLKLPDLTQVRSFPLVQAAMGDNTALRPDTPPMVALGALSKSIVPVSGQYFISAGVRFTTYGVLESFALLNIEMGNRLVISLLGLSNASMPPKVTGVSPIMRAELALKAVFDPGNGELLIMAALTDRSFLFDPACKLKGGFAIGFWFSGTYKGDFIITLGGCHHPAFHNIHYPIIPTLGVSWIINRNISIKGNAYLAVTPSCIMAGVNLQLLFESGNLKAWFYAAADFILKWKPFFYQARVRVSVGVSYRVKIFGIGKTFKVEMGADLSLWGPKFSGKVRINWTIISFTIGFGDDHPRETRTIGWDEFADSFIPGSFGDGRARLAPGSSTAAGAARLGSISIISGLLNQYQKADGKVVYIVDGFRAGFKIEQKTPCSDLYFNGQRLLRNKTEFGIVPMGLSNVRMEQHVTIKRLEDDQALPFLQAVPEVRNMPSALWGNRAPGPDAPLMRDMPVGMSITVQNPVSLIHILPREGSYAESVLSSSELIIRTAVHHSPVFEPAKVFPSEPETVLNVVKTTIGSNPRRDQLLMDTAAAFGTWNQVQTRALSDDPQAVLFAVPVLRTTGSHGS
ncbi:DUF6603 domain-containing protein [Paenibacillus ihbetae]|uniref:DUF6603 domain-containing protein n=1 Tax=Paenibacillus ihbetae TaxID=1870820 RepID=A0ABX3JYP0_9BACL|nr:DUF6603 domain-containing protein [Paenibacillus ihbetae]OOC61609.1 hypothetical protein BBD40_06890 [Paenibacillus ihbetae]